jgi:hypothetical protein
MITLRNIQNIPTFVIMAGLAFLAMSAVAGCAGHGLEPRTTYNEKTPNADGFIQHWLILEPISANGLTDSAVQRAVKREYFPDQFTVIPHDGDKVMVNDEELTWHTVETNEYNVNLYYFAYGYGKRTSNGKEVIGIYGDRQTVIDDGVSKRLTLKKGPNVVRCAIVNGGGATDFCARFLGADDKPLKGFTVRVGDTRK